MTVATTELLTDDMLARFDERAPVYDRENRFFDEDWAELKESGYLLATVPTEFGGAGLALDEYSKLVRRLAYVAPATALATNMHCYWTGVAADLSEGWRRLVRLDPRAGRRGRGVLRAARRGRQRHAAAARGRDAPTASTADGRSRATRSSAASLRCGPSAASTRWTRRTRTHPQIVHGFLPRDADGIQIIETWDTLGMRATQSQDTVLDKAFVPDELVPLVCPTGFAGAGLFHVAIFAWALMGFASSYLGAAKRAFDMTVESDAEAHVDRADQLDGAPPRGAAQGRRDAHRLRRGRGHARAHVRRLGHRRRARGLAGSPRGDAVLRDQRRPSRSSTARSTSAAAPACSSATASSRSSATCGWAASTPGTRCSRTSSSGSCASVSTPTNPPAGADRGLRLLADTGGYGHYERDGDSRARW